MPNERKRKWIVLVNKMPMGPLSIDEINAFIDGNIIRRGDPAYLVEENTGKATEWKFLGQYPEFDRRADKSEVYGPHELPLHAKRRELENNQKTESRLKSLLPKELESIRLEDLILNSAYFKTLINPPQKKRIFKKEKTSTQVNSKSNRIFILLGSPLLVAFFFLLYFLNVNQSTPELKHEISSVPIGVEAKEEEDKNKNLPSGVNILTKKRSLFISTKKKKNGF